LGEKRVIELHSGASLYILITINTINYRRYCSYNSDMIIKKEYETNPILIIF